MRFGYDQKALPHLLEQEINAISLIQFVSIKSYKSNEEWFGDAPEKLKEFALPWIQK
jgi:hypothetical protein